MALEHDLLKWPLLQRILFPEAIDLELLEALLLVDGAPKVVEHRVEHRRGRALEQTANVYIGDGLQLVFLAPLVDRVIGVLLEASVHLHLVEFDPSMVYILGAGEGDGGLEGQLQEGIVVDGEEEHVVPRVVVEGKLPLQIVVLHLHREHSWLRKFFSKKAQKLN